MSGINECHIIKKKQQQSIKAASCKIHFTASGIINIKVIHSLGRHIKTTQPVKRASSKKCIIHFTTSGIIESYLPAYSNSQIGTKHSERNIA